MSYTIERIASRLKGARERKGLSQRALGELSGVPQSHISKIENGTVDLRLSSLIELARVLGLELVLVPRNSVSAVHSIARRSEPRDGERTAATFKEFRKLNEQLSALSREHPELKEIAQLQRHAKELSRFQLVPKDLGILRDVAQQLSFFEDSAKQVDALRNALSEIQTLRNALAHSAVQIKGKGVVRPAYSLEDEDHG